MNLELPVAFSRDAEPTDRHIALAQRPTRFGFFEEVIYPQATSRTPLFQDVSYSYHVNPEDLSNGLPAFAAESGKNLIGLLVIGPTGVLWSYSVTAFLEIPEGVQVNKVVMPHGRITWKSTGRISRDDYGELMGKLFTHELLNGKQLPNVRSKILLADWSSGTVKKSVGGFDEYANNRELTDSFLEHLNRILKNLTVTYSHLGPFTESRLELCDKQHKPSERFRLDKDDFSTWIQDRLRKDEECFNDLPSQKPPQH